MSFFCISCKTSTTATYKACPYCGEPITDFLRTHLEKPIDGKYKILSRLGIGGMGEVYKVLHLHLNTLRVVKLMRPSISERSDSHDRFIREARLATRIQHPNVATLFDFSTLPDGSHYMVWEHIEGVNLGDLLRARGFLSPRYASELAVMVLHGLEAIHRSGVVHRDVSPENVMITRNDEGAEIVKIIDLGIAKQSNDEQEDQTKTGMFVGKWKYCSPEQLGLLKADERIDARADLYSFGVVLYEMLTGKPPFVADSPHRYFVLHSSETPASLRVANPRSEVPEELESLVFRALEKDREKRFASARAFATALEALIPHLPAEASGAGMSDGVDLKTLQSGVAVNARTAEDETVPESAAIVATEQVTHAETPLRRVGTAGAHSDDSLLVTATDVENVALADQTLIQTLDQERKAEATTSKRRPVMYAAAAAAFILITSIIVSMARRDEVPPETVVPASAVVPLSAAKSGIALNAFPWGEVTEIRELGSGRITPTGGAVTPATFSVAPGRYRLVVKHPEFGERTETVEVLAGGMREVNLELTDPESVKMPSFVEVPR